MIRGWFNPAKMLPKKMDPQSDRRKSIKVLVIIEVRINKYQPIPWEHHFAHYSYDSNRWIVVGYGYEPRVLGWTYLMEPNKKIKKELYEALEKAGHIPKEG